MSSHLPDGWQLSTIADCAQNVPKKYVAKEGLNPRYVGLEHISPDTKFINRWGYANDVISTKGEFKVGDTLFGKLRPYLKKVSIADFAGICSTDILILRAKVGVASGFLYRVLSSEEAILHSMESSAGNVMPRTSWKDMAVYQFLLPPLSEQKKIAAILTSVDDVIEKTQAQIDKLKDLKTGMMQELLTRGVGVDGKPHTEFKDSTVGRIPKSWEVVSVGSLVDVIDPQPDHRTPPEVENGIPYVGLGDIDKSGVINFSGARKVSQAAFEKQCKSFELHKGAFVFGKIGTIGNPSILPERRFYCLSANVVLITGLNYEVLRYIFQVFTSGIINEQIAQQTNTTSQPALGIKKVRDFLVPLPTHSEMKSLVDALSSIDQRLTVVKTKLDKLKSSKKALMQDLLTGKVRVKVED